MFTCSICDETFVGVHQNTTHATPCGHVFHNHCLVKWLDRSETCPHCRSVVKQDDLIKLFLQVDPNARVVWTKKVEEELHSLNNELKIKGEKEKIFKRSLLTLESKLKQAIDSKEQSDKKLQSLGDTCSGYQSQVMNFKQQLEAIIVGHAVLVDKKKNLEANLEKAVSKSKALDKSFYELQSVNSVVIDKLRSEIADLKSEKAYFKSKCISLEALNDNSPSTSKLTIENEDKKSLQIPHETCKLYGNDPNIIWTATNFLSGCVFLIVEDLNKYEDICSDLSMSKLNIIEHGGSVVQVYSFRITHILCATLNHYLVQQGLKDGKRCITEYWLTDVIAKENMCPPWLALHFPLPYSKKSGFPCPQYQIAIANFDVNKHQLVKTMVESTGASVVNEVSSTTDVVVSLKFEGELVESALALNKPVVNVQWLNDIIFGAKIGIDKPRSLRYQRYDEINPFLVNYEMVSHLMSAWKHPVVYLKNQQVYDLTIDDPTSPKLKRKRIDTVLKTENPVLIDLVEEDDDENDICITYISSNDKKSPPQVILCGFSTEEEEKLTQIVLKLGGNVVNKNSLVGTHMVMKKPMTSITFLVYLSSVTYVLNESWLADSQTFSTFKSELDYCIGDVYDEFNAVICNVPEILKIPNRKLFKDKFFFVSPGIKSPPVILLKRVIIAAGGTIEYVIRNAKSIKRLPPNTYFIISCEEDFHLVANVFILCSYNVVFSADFVIHSITKQRLMLEYKIVNTVLD